MRKKEVYIISFLLITLIPLISWGQIWKQSSKKIYLKASSIQEPSSPAIAGFMKFKELIEKSSEGRINIEIYDSAILGSEVDTIIQTQLGLIDINIVNVNSVNQLVKELKVLSLPFLFRDDEHFWKILNGTIGNHLLKLLESYEILCLGFYDAGERGFFNNSRDINNIEDFKDLKIRVENNEILIDMIKALGAVPVPVDFEELYSEIDYNFVDGAEESLILYYTKKFYENAKYFSFNEYLRIPDVFMINKKVWNNFAKKDQDLILNAVKESAQFQREILKKQEIDITEKCREAGCRFDSIVNNESYINAMIQVYDKHVMDILDLTIAIKNIK